MSTFVGLLASLAIGLVASLVWLLLLFGIKPRLTIDIAPRRLRKQRLPGWAFVVTNHSRATAVQIQGRLWLIRAGNTTRYATRDPVVLKVPELFTLRGTWAGNRRTATQIAAGARSNQFRFLTDSALEQLPGEWDRLLFQVWAQHSFTNFGRVQTFTMTKADLLKLAGPLSATSGGPESPGSQRTVPTPSADDSPAP
jgi:hypothetical protein